VVVLATKPATVAFKGNVKFLAMKRRFSAACMVTNAPSGATCQLRLILGSGKVVATASAPVQGAEARVRVNLSTALRRSLSKASSIRVALDLLDADGKPIAAAPRQKIDNPFDR
jgi:autotransporter translocation and assembly factor TamB